MAFRVVRFSPVLFRQMWLDASVPAAAIRARFDCSQDFLGKQARRMGLPDRRASAYRARIGGAEFEDMWRAGVRIEDLCVAFSCTQQGIHDAVTRLGLPRRPKGGGGRFLLTIERYRAGIRIGGDEFRAMWLADVSIAAMAAYFGIARASLKRVADELGLPARRMGRRRQPDVAEWREAVAAEALRAAMARSAAETRAAMMLSEMVDGRADILRAETRRALGVAA